MQYHSVGKWLKWSIATVNNLENTEQLNDIYTNLHHYTATLMQNFGPHVFFYFWIPHFAFWIPHFA